MLLMIVQGLSRVSWHRHQAMGELDHHFRQAPATQGCPPVHSHQQSQARTKLRESDMSEAFFLDLQT